MSKSLKAATLILLIASAAVGADLKDYRNRVAEATRQVRGLLKGESEETEETVRQVKESLPRSETVDFEGQTITVDNRWLHNMFDAYSVEPKPKKRPQKLSEIADRLAALDEQLALLQDAEEAASGKAEAADPREKIREILARTPYREKTDDPATAFIKEIRRKVIDFIGSILRRLFGRLAGTGAGANIFFITLIVIGLGSAIFLAIRLWGKRGATRVEKKRSVLGEEIEAGVTSADLATAALNAARAGDFRTAIRKLYISLLYELAEREVIQIEAHTTNHEYLARVAGFASLAAPMRYLTDRFDYFWYGMFSSSEEDFKQYMQRYSEAMERARSVVHQGA
jgi:Domain of unknown function (DUF4129)